MLRLKNKPGWIALDGIAVALVCLLLLELHLAIAPPAVQARPAAPIASQNAYVPSRNFSPQSALFAWRDMMLSRPIFDPTRRPPSASLSTAPLQIPRLSGIIVTPTEKIAVFSPAAGAPIIVNQNSQFGAFTVLAIADDSVTMKGPSGVIVLRSDFGAAGAPGISTAKSTLLADGIYLNLIKLALPSAINWPRPPTVH